MKEVAPSKQPVVAVTDAERSSLTFTAYDLDVHLAPEKAQLVVHARFTVRNSGTQPLSRVVLQISSSLHWESFALQEAGRTSPLSFLEHVIDTDADHTGKVQEAVVTLGHPLAPGAAVELAAFYSGEVRQSGERLERIGAPAEQAARADWDRIAPEGTALRGFGDVLWYPTAAAPVFLGDGAKLFKVAGETKLRDAGATVRLRLAVEYVGDAPDAAFFCGMREPADGCPGERGASGGECSGSGYGDVSQPDAGVPGVEPVRDRQGSHDDGGSPDRRGDGPL